VSHFKLSESIFNTKKIALIGLIGIIILQVPVTLTYTNKYPWDLFTALADQRKVYEEMLAHISANAGKRFWVPLFRSLLMPFYFVGITYLTLNFKMVNPFFKFLLIIGILCPINLSLLRGTDKEIGDQLIIFVSLMLVLYSRNAILSERNSFNLRKLFYLFIGLVFLGITFFLIFTYRKYLRVDGNIYFCMHDRSICPDYSGWVISLFPDFVKFGFGMITFYLTNGYYGQYLALGLPFDFSYGIGHCSALLTVFEKISNSKNLFELTYIYKISNLGWDYRYYWATFQTWIANDLSFPGTLIFVAYLGRLYRQAWRDAIYARNEFATVFFLMLNITFTYFSANNQVANTFDLYFTLIGSFILWKFFSRRIRL